MTTFNFKKETKLYVVQNGLRYPLDIYPDISFSQTFNETSVPVKTLHSQYNMFESAVITKANPANFTFTIPLLYESDLDVVLELLVDYDPTNVEAVVGTADIYVETNSEVYKLEKAVMESGVFQIAKDSVLLLNVSGTASKLSKFTDAIPGTLQTRTTRTYGMVGALEIVLGGVTKANIAGVTIELKNDVQWIDFATLHNSLAITDASGTMFPGAFVVQSRTLSGNIQQYVTDDNGSSVNSWEIGKALSVRVGNSSSDWLLRFEMPSIVYTNRLDVQELYLQSFDFRMDTNPSDLSQVIIKE